MISLLEYKTFSEIPEDKKLIFIKQRYPHYQQVVRIYRRLGLFVEDADGYVTPGMYK